MTSTAEPLTDAELIRADADFCDLRGNARVSLRAAVVALPYKDRACKLCDARLPKGQPLAEFRFITRRKRWSWYYCLPHAPEPVKPLRPARALSYLARTFASARSPDSIPAVAWSIAGALQPATPF